MIDGAGDETSLHVLPTLTRLALVQDYKLWAFSRGIQTPKPTSGMMIVRAASGGRHMSAHSRFRPNRLADITDGLRDRTMKSVDKNRQRLLLKKQFLI